MQPQDMKRILQEGIEGIVPGPGTVLFLFFSDEVGELIEQFLSDQGTFWQADENQMERLTAEGRIDITLLDHQDLLGWLDRTLNLLKSVAVVKRR